jgi:hypothetical protein
MVVMVSFAQMNLALTQVTTAQTSITLLASTGRLVLKISKLQKKHSMKGQVWMSNLVSEPTAQMSLCKALACAYV